MALKAQFFFITKADLLDLQQQINQPSFEVKQFTSYKKIAGILRSCSLSLALKDNKILFHFLKALKKPVSHALTLLADTCLRLEHYLAFLKSSWTIVLRKPGKSSYKSLSTWRPIALLKTIGKVVEKLLARRIRNLAEEHYLLHLSQMGARAERGTGTALKLLTSIVQTV
jgi:hypothetical protein